MAGHAQSADGFKKGLRRGGLQPLSGAQSEGRGEKRKFGLREEAGGLNFSLLAQERRFSGWRGRILRGGHYLLIRGGGAGKGGELRNSTREEKRS